MRFLINQPYTREALHMWADSNGAPLLVARFFFWRAGILEQKTVDGFLRACVYQSLDACPAFIEEITNNLENRYGRSAEAGDEIEIPGWDNQTLFRVMCAIVDSELRNRSFCFFVDALDELFDEEHSGRFGNILTQLSERHNVKICMTSRPDALLLRASQFKYTIVLKNLTSAELQHVVVERCQSWSVPRRLSDQKQLDDLKEKFVPASGGIFLWLVLALQSVEDALHLHKQMSAVETVFHELPRDVGEMYKQSNRANAFCPTTRLL